MGDRTTPGLALGRVVDVEDPQAQLRVKLQRLDRPPGVVTDWLQIAFPFASDGAGAVMMPEIDDVAVMGFLGDRAIVLGFLYGGDTAPPVTDPAERRLQSVRGHTIVLADNSDDGIRIADAHGNEIVMDSSGITITSGGDVTIRAQGSATLEAAGVTTIKGATVELNP